MTIVRLSNVIPGQAEVRIFTPEPGVRFGFSTPVGVVRRQGDGRWMALDTDNTLVLAHAATRKVAIDHLVELFKKQGR